RGATAVRAHFQEHQHWWILWLGGGFAAAVLLLIGPRAFHVLRRLRIAQRPTLEPHTAATIWYSRLLKLLSRQGIRKVPAQTPQEQVRQTVARFTVHYERARFGDSAEDAEKLPELYRELEAVSK